MAAIGGQLIIDGQRRSALLSRVTEDLKKKGASNESRWLMGQPDVDARDYRGIEGLKIIPTP